MGNQLIDYIIGEYKKGYSFEQIEAYLIRNNYPKAQVEQAMQEAWKMMSALNQQQSFSNATTTQPKTVSQGPSQEEFQKLQQIESFVKKQKQQGHDAQSIKSYLLSYGYPPDLIQKAIEDQFQSTPGHIKVPIKLLIIMGVLVFSGFLISLLFSGGEALLDYNLNTLDKQVNAGNTLRFSHKFVNMGNKKNYDVIVDYEIQSIKTHKKVDMWQETFAIDKLENQGGNRQLPENLEEGKYVLRGIVSYFDKEARAYDTFDVIATDEKAPEPTCYDGLQNGNEEDIDCGGECISCDDIFGPSCADGIKNQGEKGIDCGGPCLACTYEETCDDGIENQNEKGIDCGGVCDPCPGCYDGIKNQNEIEIDCGGVCKYCDNQIEETCYDGIKNQNEEEIDCGGVCDECKGAKEDISYVDESIETSLSDEQIINRVKTISEDEIEDGIKLCNSIDDLKKRDDCFNTLATNNVNSSKVCKEIESIPKADVCYMYFVNNKDYTVCDLIHNSYIKRSCKSLKQINELTSKKDTEEEEEEEEEILETENTYEEVDMNSTTTTDTGNNNQTLDQNNIVDYIQDIAEQQGVDSNITQILNNSNLTS